MSDLFDAPKKLLKGLPDPAGLFSGNEDGGGGRNFGNILGQVLSQVQPQAVSEPQTLLTPTTMPSPTSGDTRQAKRRSYADQLARKGRASTILTNDDGLGASG